MTVILVLERLRHEDLQFEARLGYIVKPHLKTQNTQRANIQSGLYLMYEMEARQA